jgi:flagellar M-ring protein FliF
MEQFAKLGPVQAFTRFWGTLTGTQRFVTAVFISTSVVVLVVVSVVATRPRMSVLFSGLRAEDAGAIVAKLQETKIPYEVDGSAVKVPASSVYETRMTLASQGLPQGGNVGFEIFDKGNFGMTEFAQRLNYQRALQGELSRTIDQLDQVVESRVHIAIPEASVFTDKQKEPTASVVLKMRAGGRLEQDRVAGIVHLVSSAVEGLDPAHVTVVDTRGNMLSESTDDPAGLDPRMSASQLKLKREYERQVEQDIQSMLEQVLGPNKAIVRANAKVNFDRKETDSELYQPAQTNRGVLLSEQRLDESYSGNSGTVGGVVGVRANVRPGGAAVSKATGEGGYQRTETTSKYEVSKTTEHVVTAPGQVEKMSVAVMVDGKVDAGKIPVIQNAVATAAGIEPQRGDKVTVEGIAFDDSAIKKEDTELQAMASRSTYLSIGKSVAGALLLFGFLFLLRRMLKQISVSVPPPVTVKGVLASPAAVLAGHGSDGDPGNGGAAPNATQAQPEEVAQTLRKWMSES